MVVDIDDETGEPFTVLVREPSLTEFTEFYKDINLEDLQMAMNIMKKNPQAALKLFSEDPTVVNLETGEKVEVPEDVEFDFEKVKESFAFLCKITSQVLIDPKLTVQEIKDSRGMIGLLLVTKVFKAIFAGFTSEQVQKKLS